MIKLTEKQIAMWISTPEPLRNFLQGLCKTSPHLTFSARNATRNPLAYFLTVYMRRTATITGALVLFAGHSQLVIELPAWVFSYLMTLNETPGFLTVKAALDLLESTFARQFQIAA